MAESEYKIIAESSNDLRIELIKKINEVDIIQIAELSKELESIFGVNSSFNSTNINKYFNKNTFPFITRLNGEIIGFIVGVPLENFSNESWSHYDTNLGKFNTIYTYTYLMKKFYRKKGGYSKTLKIIYINWCKKQGYKYVAGHVQQGISKQFSSQTDVIKIFPKWYDCTSPFEYYRRRL